MKIKIIVPITLRAFQKMPPLNTALFWKRLYVQRPRIRCRSSGTRKRPVTIESEYDGALAEAGAIAL